MAIAIELTSLENVVKDSGILKLPTKAFEYNLNEKAATTKLIKGAKIPPFDLVFNSSSCNLIFNLGPWHTVVLPSIKYWSDVMGSKLCNIGDINIKIADVKTGKDVSGKHIDTQIIVFINRDKVVLHCYNTTQLILVNGHGYSRLVEVFLKPYFESKVDLNATEIDDYNREALIILEGGRKVKQSTIKYSGSPTYLKCAKCDYAALSRIALVKHKKTHQGQSISSSSSSLVLPKYQSTRNNSVSEVMYTERLPLLNDNVTLTDDEASRQQHLPLLNDNVTLPDDEASCQQVNEQVLQGPKELLPIEDKSNLHA